MSKTWEEHWASGHTPWDSGSSAPVLTEWLKNRVGTGRALVPGCGRGYDVFSLARAGFIATGLDLAPSVREAFERERESQGLSPKRARLSTEDFFEHRPEEPYALLFDYTFLCAIQPAQRAAWARKAAQLLGPGGTLVTLVFPILPEAPPDQGPPFPIDPEEVSRLVSKTFQLQQRITPQRSHPGREGKELLLVWKKQESETLGR